MFQRFQRTWQLLRRKAFKAKTPASQLAAAAAGNAAGAPLQKVLGGLDLTFLGVGGIIGAGVFVLTGVAARDEAGCDLTLQQGGAHSCADALLRCIGGTRDAKPELSVNGLAWMGWLYGRILGDLHQAAQFERHFKN